MLNDLKLSIVHYNLQILKVKLGSPSLPGRVSPLDSGHHVSR